MSSERYRPSGVGIGTLWGCPKPRIGWFRRYARSRRPGRPLPNDPFMRTHEGYHYPLLPRTSRPPQVDPRPWVGVSGRLTCGLSYSALSDIISGSSSPRTCFSALVAVRGIQGSRPNRIDCGRSRPFPRDPWQGDSRRVSPDCSTVPCGQPRAHLGLAPACSHKSTMRADAAVGTSASARVERRAVTSEGSRDLSCYHTTQTYPPGRSAGSLSRSTNMAT